MCIWLQKLTYHSCVDFLHHLCVRDLLFLVMTLNLLASDVTLCFYRPITLF